MNSTCIGFGILFLIFGILFYIGKIHIHAHAWKNMPVNEKSIIRIKPLCHNIGAVIIVCGLIFLISGVWADFKETAFIWAMVAWMILSGLDVYYIGKSKRYRLE